MSGTKAVTGLLAEGKRSLDDGRPGRAIDSFTRALGLDPRNATAFELRAVAREECKQVAGAIEDYTVALRLRPGAGEVHYNRGFARKAVGNLRGAAQDFAAALKTRTLRDDLDLTFASAEVAWELGKPVVARKHARRALELSEKELARAERSLAGLPPRARRVNLKGLGRSVDLARALLERVSGSSETQPGAQHRRPVRRRG